MKRLVSPVTYSQLHAVEHPPLMMKQLVQGICGGLRWLETKELAEFIAQKAIKEGFYAKKKKSGTRRTSRGNYKNTLEGREALTSGENALDHYRGISLVANTIPSPKKRLVSYDVLDCTLGGGYHSGAILENGNPYTRVVALDCDPDAATVARDLAQEFGSNRFRFLCANMSSIYSMFGERSFDAVMIDPGPSVQQLEDPVRGFLLQDENDHALDMRYGPNIGTPLLSFLNTVPQRTLALSLAEYELLTMEQSVKFARIIRKGRPFKGSMDFFEKVEWVGTDEPLSNWTSQSSRRKAPMPWELVTSLRCLINDEKSELLSALRHAFLLVRDNGRVVVFSRLPWEEKLIEKAIQDHPHALLSYSETIDNDNVKTYDHSRHTKMWVAQRSKSSSFVLKNTVQPASPEKVKESHLRWMTGLYAGQSYGFPANNLTFENLEPGERRAMKRNSLPPPPDYDDDDRQR